MADPLHVVHVVLSLDVGGLERVVLHLTRQAPLLNQRVSIVCMEKRGALSAEAEALGATVHCLEKPPGMNWAVRREAKKLLTTLRPDVIHTHQIGALFYASTADGRGSRRARNAADTKYPIIIHTEHGKQLHGWKKQLLAWWSLRSATAIVAVSHDIARSLGRLASSAKISVIPNGIDVAAVRQPRDTAQLRQQWNLPGEALIIGTVGRLASVKRHDLLLATFSMVVQKIPTCYLLIVGDGEQRQSLEVQAQSMGLMDRVRFVGMQADPAGYLQLFSAFVFTSESEGLPLSLLEAWAAGVPVLAFAVGGLPEVIQDGETGLLIPFGETEQLAKKLLMLLQDKGLVHQVSQRCHEKVTEEYDVLMMARKYDETYRSHSG